MNINIETNTMLNVASDELDVIARELCGVKLSLADSGVPAHYVQSVSTNGITALTSDGVHSDTLSALLSIGVTVLTAITYLRILDPEVGRLLSTFFNGQEGLPINYTDVVNSTDVNFLNLFQGNTDIVNFDELKYFSWYNSHGYFSFKNCSNLESIDLSNTLVFPSNFASGCGHLRYFHGLNSTEGELIINGNAVLNSSMLDLYGYANGNTIYLTKVIFQEGITYIPARFARSCNNLKEVVIPSSCLNIWSQAFWGCRNIQKVNIVDLDAWVNINFGDKDSNPLFNGSGYLYLNGQKVTSYIYSDGTTQVKKNTWCGNKGLESIYLPQTITSIGEYAFLNCSNLVIQDLNLPNLTSLGYYVFSGTKVQAVSNLGNITSIDNYAFYNCTDLTSVNIPEGVTSIGQNAFRGCSGLTAINIPNSVTSISAGAFYGCAALTSITIPDNVTSDLDQWFHTCNAITTVVLGSGITRIKAYAFRGDLALRSLTVKAVTPPVCENNALEQSAVVGYYNNYCDIYVPAGSVDAYKTADGWSAAATRIQAIPE